MTPDTGAAAPRGPDPDPDPRTDPGPDPVEELRFLAGALRGIDAAAAAARWQDGSPNDEALTDLVREARYASAFSFKYSRRPGTPAAALPGQVTDAVKDERLARLQALLNQQQTNFNASLVGRTVPVLFEKPGRHAGQVVGRSPYLQPVHIEGPQSLIGRIAAVTIAGAAKGSLSGALTSARLEPA